QFWVRCQITQCAGHFRAVSHHQKIVTNAEPMFAIVPWRGNKRDAASERLKHADGRNSREQLGVETPWHVDGREMVGEQPGCSRIRDPATIARGMPLEGALCFRGIAHPINVERQPRFLRRPQKIFDQLVAALAVTPIADPNEAIASRYRGWRMEAPRVRCLMPDEHAVAP